MQSDLTQSNRRDTGPHSWATGPASGSVSSGLVAADSATTNRWATGPRSWATGPASGSGSGANHSMTPHDPYLTGLPVPTSFSGSYFRFVPVL